MLIRTSEVVVINTQQATRLYVEKTFDEHEVICETLDHLYTIKKMYNKSRSGGSAG